MSTNAWNDLLIHQKSLLHVKIADLFAGNSERFSQFSLQANGILYDYSKQRITVEGLAKLIQLADEARLQEHISALFSGKVVNFSEQRPALHSVLRDPTPTPFPINGHDIKHEIHISLKRLEQCVERIRSGEWLGATGSKITDIISLGIGGSDLGPSMVCQALNAYKTTNLNIHFISNVDGLSLATVLNALDPITTLCIINSKTFTTPETLQNAKTVKAWLQQSLGSKGCAHLIGVTAHPNSAQEFGIVADNIFEFWDFIGGRYSVWSSVGLPIALLIGMQNFKDFLAGAHEMDRHFHNAPFLENMPVLMALLGIWNINFWDCHTLAIIPYADGLKQFPDYLQQLEMESNGKKAAEKTGFVEHHTAPVIWGGVGCNGQHAYMQLLHQGTQIIPVDFLMATEAYPGFEAQHTLLVASCLSQSKALMEGNGHGIQSDPLNDAKRCLGDRPSSTLLYPKLTPFVLGSLIALYEHKVFAQGVIWGINSFDQWGVELGKKWVKKIYPYLEDRAPAVDMDSSTAGLIQYFQRHQTKNY